MASRFLSPAYEVMLSAASPAINFGRGLAGYQDPIGTPAMQDRMLELEAQKGPSGSIGYEDYGLNPIAGRYIEGLPSLFSSSPIDFGLAGSIGRYGYGPEGRTGLEYDFTSDPNTGSTGNTILDFINRGGLKNAISGMGTAQASEVTPQSEPLDVEDYLGTSTPQDLGFIGSAPSVFTPTPTEYTAYAPSVEIEQPLQEKGIGSMLKNLIPGSLFATLLSGILPKESPQMKAAKSFYENQYGLTPGGSVASGIMAGYNPVSGGLLNMLTGGAYGSPPNIGLQRAYQQRINMIKNTLAKKYADGDYSGTQLDEKLAELQRLKTAEQMAMEKPTIDKAKTAAPDVYKDAGDKGTLGAGGGFSTSGGGSFGGFESASSSPSGRGRQDW
jgi:hypothetical protein